MARHADDETPLRDFHAQGFAQRTMARLLNLSPSTVAKRLTQLGLAAPADPPPCVSTKRMSHGYPEIPEPMLNDLCELVDWWQAKREALPHAQEASCKMERVSFDVEQRWLEARRRHAERDGTTITQVVNQAFQAFFAEKQM
jgi:hypothetical protein